MKHAHEPWMQGREIRLVALRPGDDGPEIGIVYDRGDGAVNDWSYPLRFAELDPESSATIIIANFIEPQGADPNLEFAVLSTRCAYEVWERLRSEAGRSRLWELTDISIEVGAERPELAIDVAIGDTTTRMRFPLKHEDLIRDAAGVTNEIVEDVLSSVAS